ncbi:MAG: helix-turn-helix transcriptional regulator [Oscillospiraceae bacterium]
MNVWYRQLQQMTDAIEEAIREGGDDRLTLEYLATTLGYSPFHTTRMFRSLTGVSLREYLGQRRLAFALIRVRDTAEPLLDIALEYGFSSHEAFSRAFKRAYGVSPGLFRKNPVPVVLRTKLNPLDSYILGLQESDAQSERSSKTMKEEIKIYNIRIPAHKFLHIKNYESDGYFDFWQKQDAIPGQDCDTVCGLLDSIKGKLDGEDGVIGKFSGQIMGYPREKDGRIPEAYGVRLPLSYAGPIPEGMLLIEVEETDYIVFEHGPFSFEQDGGAVFEQLGEAIRDYKYEGTGWQQDDSPGRIAYFYHDPERFIKRVLPVRKAQ